MSEERVMISCHKGLAPISFPKEWLKDFNMDQSFAREGKEGRIIFPNGRAFGVSTRHDGATVVPIVRELSQAEIENTNWGSVGPPWESYETTRLFGHGKVTRID